MPLSNPLSRKLLHLRDIQLRGYIREDGRVDIDARMTDTKTYSYNSQDRGLLGAGVPVHDMWIRLTISSDMMIQSCEVVMDSTPFVICSGAAPNFQRLVGLQIGKGFIKAAMQRLGGVEGCTHLRELLQPIGTVAFQTMSSLRNHDGTGAQRKLPAENSKIPTALENTCYAYDVNGPLGASQDPEATTK